MPETRNYVSDQPTHTQLRDGSWLVDEADRPYYLVLRAAGESHEESVLRCDDRDYDLHCLRAIRFELEPLSPAQWRWATDLNRRRRDGIDSVDELMLSLGRVEQEPTAEWINPYTGRPRGEPPEVPAWYREQASEEPAGSEIRPVAPREPESGTEGLDNRSERAATRFSTAKNLPRHRPDRPSQLPPARHVRYVKARAAEWGVSLSEADQRIAKHPKGCPFQEAHKPRKTRS